MPLHRDAIKQARRALKRRALNRAAEATLRTVVKRISTAVEAKDAKEAKLALAEATRSLDRAVTHGILKRNTASRKISRLSLQVKKAFAAQKSA